jgi:hypothetical protein
MSEESSLSRRFRQTQILARQLEDSIALEKALPGIFDYGSVKTTLYSIGTRGRPMFRIVKENGTCVEKPLIDMPVEVIRLHSDLIQSVIKRSPCHTEWRKAKKLMRKSEEEVSSKTL